MKIINANTIKAKEDILDLIAANGDRASLDNWLTFNLGTDVFGAWLVVKDEPIGVLLCEINGMQGDQAWISFLILPKGIHAYEGLLSKADSWAQEKGIRNFIFYSKNRKTAERHGFKFITSVFTKEIDNGSI
jgi:hypothetical protein